MPTPTTFTTRVTFDHVRNTAAGFTADNPVLGYGVIAIEGDEESTVFRVKIGDGVTAWNDMPYAGGDGPIAIEDIEGLADELAALAPIANPTFTGTVSGVTKSMVGLGNVDNTSDVNKPVSTAQATADTAVATAAAADATTKANAALAAAIDYTDTGLATHTHGNINADGKWQPFLDEIQPEADFVMVVEGGSADLKARSSISASLVGGLSTVATTGDYNDLDNLPSLFSGDYGDLANVPSTFSPAPKVVTALGTISGTVTPDANARVDYDLTASGNITLANPSGTPVNGQVILFRVTQGSGGSKTVTLGGSITIPSSASSPLPWSTAEGACDYLAIKYHAGRSEWDVVSFVPGY
jgi:hypothetical protein